MLRGQQLLMMKGQKLTQIMIYCLLKGSNNLLTSPTKSFAVSISAFPQPSETNKLDPSSHETRQSRKKARK
jgi:hypothetical protein